MTDATLPLVWLSFVGDKGSLGVSIVRAADFVDAIRVAHKLTINPGGYVQGFVIPPPFDADIDAIYHHRLIPPEEARLLSASLDGLAARRRGELQ